MSDFSLETKIEGHEKKPLYGLNDEFSKILGFCRMVWSEEWPDKKTMYGFNPTIMLHGSPGTGKTTLLKNIAHDLHDEDFKYFTLSLELLLDKDLGASSKNLIDFFARIHDLASQDFKIFMHFDDVDSILCSRYTSNESSGVKRLVNTFIREIDKIQSTEHKYTPIISTTTNTFLLIDTAVKRRFSLKFSIENRVSIVEFENWLNPIILDLEIDDDTDYFSLHKIMRKRELTNHDVNLIMQDVFLEKISGSKVSYETLVEKFEKSESSRSDFEEQRTSLGRFRN